MLKYLLLAGAMTISMPALAQDKPADTSGAPASQAVPAKTVPQAAPVPTDPADPGKGQVATPVDQAMQGTSMTQATDPGMPQNTQAAIQPVPADPNAAPPAQTAAQPASKADQVAQVVNNEFPSYDKDKNGSLSEAEFSSWMVALKTASDPATKAESASTKAWVDEAFASADKDKSKSLSKAEVTGFLSQG